MGLMGPRRNGQKHIFFTVFASVMVVALVPIFFLSASFYYKSYRDIVGSVSEFQNSFLDDFGDRFGDFLAESIRQAHELAQNPRIQDLEQYPDTVFYERLEGPFSQQALYGLYQYLEIKSSFLAELQSFSARNEYVWKAKYFVGRLNWVLTSSSHGYPVGSDQKDVEWYSWYLQEDAGAYAFFFQMVENAGASRDALVLAVRPFWSGGNTCVIIHIDLQLALADIIETLPAYPVKGALTLTHDNGTNLFTHTTGDFDLSSSTSRVTTVTKPAEAVSAVVTLALSKDEYMRRLSGIGTIALLSAALVLSIIIFGILISLRITRPIARLAAMVRFPNVKSGDHSAFAGDEVQQIEYGLEHLMDKNSALESQVHASIPIYRDNFLRGMLFGETHTQSDISKQFAFLDIPLEPSDIIVFVLLLELDTKEEHVQRAQTLQAKNVTHQLLIENGDGLEIELSKNRIAVVMNGTSKSLKKVLVFADLVLESLDSPNSGAAHIGVGYPYESHEMIRRSFEEAEEALNYVSLQPDSDTRVFFIGDIRLIRTRPFVYPVELETRLSNMIMSGNREAALGIFSSLIENFQKQRLILHKYRIHHIILRLMNMVNDRLSEAEPNHRVPSDQYSSVIEKMESGHENEVFEFLETVIGNLSDKIQNSHAEKEFVIVSRICEMIESDCRDVSLQSVSDELALSASLVSRLFKKIKGVGFSDYLTSYRMEIGLKLLTSTDLSVGQISKRVGYSNSNYFIRIFREHNEITPGDYRKAHKRAQ